jgi:uncharacterized membrane protein YkoI
VTAEDPRFKAKTKVSLEDALAIHAGEVLETEYAVEADGGASYEFDINTASGKETEVESDAL